MTRTTYCRTVLRELCHVTLALAVVTFIAGFIVGTVHAGSLLPWVYPSLVLFAAGSLFRIALAFFPEGENEK